MGCLGNILWFLLGGFVTGICWALTGLLWCLTILGIPVGLQCFKFAGLCFAPFGKEIVFQGSAGSVLLNIVWLICGGIEIALISAISGLVCCLTIIGIPFGVQHFKLAKLALMPFGASVVNN